MLIAQPAYTATICIISFSLRGVENAVMADVTDIIQVLLIMKNLLHAFIIKISVRWRQNK